MKSLLISQGTEDLTVLPIVSPKPIMGLLNVPAGVSRIHASRRVFQHLATAESDLAIIHHVNFPGAAAEVTHRWSIDCLLIHSVSELSLLLVKYKWMDEWMYG